MNGRLETLQEQSLSRVAGNRRSIAEQPLWKSRLRVAPFSRLFFCLFLLSGFLIRFICFSSSALSFSI